MKRGVLLAVCILVVVLVTVSFFGTAAAVTEGVSPTLTVSNSLALAMEDTGNVQWGSQSAGGNLTGTIQARISGNANWSLTVQSTSGYPGTNELTDDNHKIASSCFTYTSAAGTPAPPTGNGLVTSTSFDGSNQTAVWSDGTATGDCRVAITYDLQIPASQAPGAYTATHTYTLVP